MQNFYDGNRVVIQNVAPCWNGKEGTVLRWVHDNWYIVLCDNTELVLDASRNEMVPKA